VVLGELGLHVEAGCRHDDDVAAIDGVDAALGQHGEAVGRPHRPAIERDGPYAKARAGWLVHQLIPKVSGRMENFGRHDGRRRKPVIEHHDRDVEHVSSRLYYLPHPHGSAIRRIRADDAGDREDTRCWKAADARMFPDRFLAVRTIVTHGLVLKNKAFHPFDATIHLFDSSVRNGRSIAETFVCQLIDARNVSFDDVRLHVTYSSSVRRPIIEEWREDVDGDLDN
jgi:hypothetical protein